MDAKELTNRQLTILQAIISIYLDTGEPVGSRTISKKCPDLALSPSTIRNEMNDLEDMGLIMQPHTSAGRIPSDKGYRLYVDLLLADEEERLRQQEDRMLEKVNEMGQLLKQTADVLAHSTNYMTMVTAPRSHQIKFIQLSAMDEHSVLAVIVFEGNMIKNKIIETSEPIDNETMFKLNMLLNTILTGMDVTDINLGLIAKIKAQAKSQSPVINDVIDTVAETICIDGNLQIYTSGTTNIFRYPEISDKTNAKEILDAVNEKDEFKSLVSDNAVDDSGIQVYIGHETDNAAMKDCSIVVASYDLGDGMKGTIGLIGPKRMDYKQVLTSMRELQNELKNMFI